MAKTMTAMAASTTFHPVAVIQVHPLHWDVDDAKPDSKSALRAHGEHAKAKFCLYLPKNVTMASTTIAMDKLMKAAAVKWVKFVPVMVALKKHGMWGHVAQASSAVLQTVRGDLAQVKSFRKQKNAMV